MQQREIKLEAMKDIKKNLQYLIKVEFYLGMNKS